MYELLNEYLTTEFESGVIGRDTRKLIKKTTDVPFRYICQIRNGATLETSQYIGTGFLIDKQTIMTAAHVVFGTKAEELFIIPAKNGFGDDTKNNPFGVAIVTKLIINPAFNNSDGTTHRDYAMAHVDVDFSDDAGFLGSGTTKTDKVGSIIFDVRSKKHLPLPPGQLTINISGYPADRPTKAPDNQKGDWQYLAYNRTAKWDKDVYGKKMLYHVADVYHGHSGSPVWVKRSPDHGGRNLIGIHVGRGDYNKKKNKRINNRAVFINEEVYDFIMRNKK